MKGRGEMTNEIFKHIIVWNIRVPKINFKNTRAENDFWSEK